MAILLALLTLLAHTWAANPNITLPWGTYLATSYSSVGDFWLFQDVRYAQAPVGSLRLQAPQAPAKIQDPNTIITNPKSRYACPQISFRDVQCPSTKEEIPIGDPEPQDFETEDCLFLDIYVPNNTFTQPIKPTTPVIVWFHGGAYAFGAKTVFSPLDPIYAGDGMLQLGHNNKQDVIFVAANYRLGAFGWLAGTSMESKGLPNAGLYDQHLVLDFVQKYIGLVGGNNKQVSAWGESAGASSILHHLVAKWPDSKLGFSRAVVQSPAYQVMWDRKGTLETDFQKFSSLVNCTGSVACIQGLNDSRLLMKQNQNFFVDNYKCTGMFPIGPALDNKLITQLPSLALESGHRAQIDSIIVSHVADEARTFVPRWIKSNDNVTQFIDYYLPGPELEDVRNAVKARYPPQSDYFTRISDLIRDSSFNCNTRQLYNSYSKSAKVFMMVYNLFAAITKKPATHAQDILPAFWASTWTNLPKFLEENFGLPSNVSKVAAFLMSKEGPAYQKLLLGHAINGNPNTYSNVGIPNWFPATTSGGSVTNALYFAGLGLSDGKYTDEQTTSTICDFWIQVSKNISSIFNIPTSLDGFHEDPSKAGPGFRVQIPEDL